MLLVARDERQPDLRLAHRDVHPFAVVLDVSFADLLARVGVTVSPTTPLAEILTIPLPRVGALLPYLMLILVLLIKPRGLMGTRDT